MADSYIQVAPDSTGKKMQTFENTVSTQDVHAEAVTNVDSTGTELFQAANPGVVGFSDGTTDIVFALTGASVPNQVPVSIQDGTHIMPTGDAPARSINVEQTDGTNIIGTSSHPTRVDPTGTTVQPVSGTVSATQGTSPWVENKTQVGGTVIQAAQTSSTDGTGANEVVRSINRKFGQILTTTPLGSNAVYTSAWFDTNQTGDVTIFATARADQASAANGFIIQETDDTADSNFIFNITASASNNFGIGVTVGANTTTPIYAQVRRRYWRVQYTNGASVQGSFKVAVSASSLLIQNATSSGGGAAGISPGGPVVGIGTINQFSLPSDNVTSPTNFCQVGNYPFVYAPNGSTTPWAYARTPAVFKTASATSSGNTALWTPTSGKKFRLMRYNVLVTNAAYLSVAGTLTITFQDNTTGIPIAYDVSLPGAAITTPDGVTYDSGWIDLGNGILSASANNVLNINLSAALSAGNVRVNCCGTEE